jgi:DNA replication and repair protein RecF
MNAIVELKREGEKGLDTGQAKSCWLSALYIKNFRNHATLSLSLPSAAPIILTGPNGAGKTSLLEAISLLGPGRGLRQASPNKIVNKNADEPVWGISAKISRAENIEDKISILCRAEKTTQTKIKINNRPASSVELAKHLSLFWLTPAMARFYSEGSERAQRRKFIDRIVRGIEQAHAKNLADFDRLKKQRQIVLENNQEAAWLEVLERQMAEFATLIAQARNDVMTALNAKIAELIPDNFPIAVLSASGPFEDLSATLTYQEQLVKNRTRDKLGGRTHLGPHQTDFILLNKNQNQLAQQSSTGEVKALLLGLVLAAASIASLTKNLTPIILLDEVAAHLDEQRRFALFDRIEKLPAQVWLTGTDPKTFTSLKMDGHFFDIQPSSVQPS